MDDPQQALRRLFELLNLPVPSGSICGVDVYLPILDRIRQEGAVFLLKWDGERSNNQYTALAKRPQDEEFFRLDGPTIEAVLSRVVLDYAHHYWNLPKERTQ